MVLYLKLVIAVPFNMLQLKQELIQLLFKVNIYCIAVPDMVDTAVIFPQEGVSETSIETAVSSSFSQIGRIVYFIQALQHLFKFTPQLRKAVLVLFSPMLADWAGGTC